jgi:hypothetical protein
VIPGERAREFLHERDPGFDWPRGGLTEGSRRWLIAYQLLAMLALGLVAATLAVPRVAHDRADAAHVGFGFALHFVSVDETVWNPPSYPQTYRFDPWEDIFHVNGWLFAMDWLLVTGVLWLGLWLLRRRVTARRPSPTAG